MLTSQDNELEVFVPFLGSRTYLQGPSVLETIQQIFETFDSYSFKVRSTLSTNTLILSLVPRRSVLAAAEYHWIHGGHSRTCYIYSGSPIEPEMRSEFDENSITDFAVIDGDSVTLNTSVNFQLPTTIVSLNKYLLKKVWPISGAGRWVFIGLNITTPPIPDLLLTVKITSIIKSQFLVRSAAYSGRCNIGTVDFLWR
jgi:hypothetical protein